MFDQFQLLEFPEDSLMQMKEKVKIMNGGRFDDIKDNKKKKEKTRTSTLAKIIEIKGKNSWDDLKKLGIYSRKTIYNWQMLLKEYEQTENQVNYGEGEFITYIKEQNKKFYRRHYHLMETEQSPLGVFLTKQPFLHEV